MQERRQRKGKKSSDENNNNEGNIHVTIKRCGRGEDDTTDAVVVGYENTMARWYVRNVSRLHRRHIIETKPQ